MFSMRKPASKFLSLFLVLAMVCSLFGAAFAAEEETATPYVIPDVDGKVVILHTNDTHGADLDEEGTSFGMAGVAQLKKDFEAAGADVLLLDGLCRRLHHGQAPGERRPGQERHRVHERRRL